MKDPGTVGSYAVCTGQPGKYGDREEEPELWEQGGLQHARDPG